MREGFGDKKREGFVFIFLVEREKEREGGERGSTLSGVLWFEVRGTRRRRAGWRGGEERTVFK